VVVVVAVMVVVMGVVVLGVVVVVAVAVVAAFMEIVACHPRGYRIRPGKLGNSQMWSDEMPDDI